MLLCGTIAKAYKDHTIINQRSPAVLSPKVVMENQYYGVTLRGIVGI